MVYCPMRTLLENTFGQLWNTGGPIALKHVLVPFFMTIYHVSSRGRVYKTGYVFGIRIFRCQVAA